ncbi:sortase, partial [Candidatus Curtissbacteria bacterium]|nr:sortase [Candidatus Curtissbacteria bacterium]
GAEASFPTNVQVVADPDGFSYFTTDYKPQNPRPKEFYLTVPKLKIKGAKVLVDNLNFYKNLSHFPGSAIPGEAGNSFITGHSVLPQFADPEDYRAIFTKLSDLEIGDDVVVEIEGRTLHFTVQYAKVVDPHDTSVLAPISPSGRNLTLMTCVPPGTNSKRLVVITSLI